MSLALLVTDGSLPPTGLACLCLTEGESWTMSETGVDSPLSTMSLGRGLRTLSDWGDLDRVEVHMYSRGQK